MMKKLISLPLLSVILLMLTACESKSQQTTSAEPEKTIETTKPTQITQILDPQGFMEKLQANPGAQLIDVRTPGEVASGYIAEAQNMDIQSPDFKEQLSTLDPSKPVFVYCAKGGRSGQSAEMLKKMGFKEIYDLKGGLTQWKASGKPLVTPNN
ncbi:MAG: rhodanese-like domain-containing protein [Bacteroidia bacterium]|nr:rhodanese-like domain-containing protein [Bacteroidia bacterium]